MADEEGEMNLKFEIMIKLNHESQSLTFLSRCLHSAAMKAS